MLTIIKYKSYPIWSYKILDIKKNQRMVRLCIIKQIGMKKKSGLEGTLRTRSSIGVAHSTKEDDMYELTYNS